MKHENICKLITSKDADRLLTLCFVCERDPWVMQAKTRLRAHTVYLITAGGGVMHIGSDTLTLGVGTAVFGFAEESFWVEPSENLEYMYVGFEGNRAQELFRRFGISLCNRCFAGNEGLIPFWRDSILRADSENSDLISESVLTYTFSRLCGTKKQRADVIDELMERIEEAFTDHTLSLSSLADEMGYNPKYLSHSFKEKVGMGFSAYLRTVRLKHAVFLMEHGVESIKNIAYLCGFSDPLYFSSVFKESLGVSPKEYILKQN